MDFEGQDLYERRDNSSILFSVSDEWVKYSAEFVVAENSLEILPSTEI